MSILFVAPVGDTVSGYGNASVGILSVINRMVAEGRVDSVSVFDTSKPISLEAEISDRKHDICIMVVNPTIIAKNMPASKFLLEKARRVAEKIYLSVVWETEPLPPSWNVLWDSPALDGFLCPSYFVGKQIQAVSKKPVFYYPHYIDIESFPPINREVKAKEDIFTVLFLGQNTMRKGLADSITSYTRALAKYQDTRMIVKYHNISDSELDVESLIKARTRSNTSLKDSRIYAYCSDMSREEVNELMSKSSVLLFPTRGEGFGLPPQECMALGIPVIYTPWSATPEVCAVPGNHAVHFVLDEAHSMYQYGYEYNTQYAVPLISSIMQSLDEMYQLWKADRKEYYNRTKDHREIVEERFGYTKISRYIQNIVEGVQTDFSVYPYDLGEDYEIRPR